MRLPLVALAVALLLSGCSGNKPAGTSSLPSSPPPAPIETGQIVIGFRVPNDWNEELRYNVSIILPDHHTVVGFLFKHAPETTNCLVPPPTRPQLLCPSDNPVMAGGGLRNADAYAVSPYPYATMAEVPFNGTWRIQVEQSYDQLAGGDVHHQPPIGSGSCVAPIFSAVNMTLVAANAAWQAPGCYSSGTLDFEWKSKSWNDSNATRNPNQA